jgi:hypothetical protein
LVEDNENDVALVRRTFAKAGVATPMKIVTTSEAAIAYLRHEGRTRTGKRIRRRL